MKSKPVKHKSTNTFRVSYKTHLLPCRYRLSARFEQSSVFLITLFTSQWKNSWHYVEIFIIFLKNICVIRYNALFYSYCQQLTWYLWNYIITFIFTVCSFCGTNQCYWYPACCSLPHWACICPAAWRKWNSFLCGSAKVACAQFNREF